MHCIRNKIKLLFCFSIVLLNGCAETTTTPSNIALDPAPSNQIQQGRIVKIINVEDTSSGRGANITYEDNGVIIEIKAVKQPCEYQRGLAHIIRTLDANEIGCDPSSWEGRQGCHSARYKYSSVEITPNHICGQPYIASKIIEHAPNLESIHKQASEEVHSKS
ncbi:hypothetical protein FAI41_07605 [Acetobacteraceae bacterium]|nr:hypothetical protein FAI41_07605 [Acetobacteraceae bacterium]